MDARVQGTEEIRKAGTPATGRRLQVVALGGGTGLPVVLRGLVEHPEVQLAAVVAMSDDGGSSGRLRRTRGGLPPGDVRNCLAALASEDAPLAPLFQHRFGGSGALRGHALGNLLLAAEAERSGDFLAAVARVALLLKSRGRVLPCTLEPVELLAFRDSGPPVLGQRWLSRGTGRVVRVELSPSLPVPAPGVLSLIQSADLVVLGPGSLFSSVLPPLLVAGVAAALARSRALKVWVANLVTQRGETCGMDAADHLAALKAHAGEVVDVALVNDRPLSVGTQDLYARSGGLALDWDEAGLRDHGVVPCAVDLLREGPRARHCPAKVARALMALAIPRGSA